MNDLAHKFGPMEWVVVTKMPTDDKHYFPIQNGKGYIVDYNTDTALYLVHLLVLGAKIWVKEEYLRKLGP